MKKTIAAILFSSIFLGSFFAQATNCQITKRSVEEHASTLLRLTQMKGPNARICLAAPHLEKINWLATTPESRATAVKLTYSGGCQNIEGMRTKIEITLRYHREHCVVTEMSLSTK